jgi:hypothetical protein
MFAKTLEKYPTSVTSHSPPTHLPLTSHSPPTHLPLTSHSPPTSAPSTDIQPENGNCNVCQNVAKASTIDTVYPRKPKLYIFVHFYIVGLLISFEGFSAKVNYFSAITYVLIYDEAVPAAKDYIALNGE